MRLLIATGVYPPEGGGPATYSKLLEERLPATGIAVEVLPFRTVRHWPKLVRHVVYFFKVLSRGRDVDLIFAQDPVSVGLPASLAARLLGKRFVLKMVGDYAWEQGRQRFGVGDSLDVFQTKRYGVAVEVLRRIERSVARRAVRVVVPSQYLKRIVLQWGVSEEKIKVIYNGVDFTERPTAPDARPAGKLLVTVARLVSWKGIDALIDVVAREPEWDLVVVGDGPSRAALEAHAMASSAKDRVQFMGNLSHPQTLGWMSVADVFVLNSSYEGLAHVLLEAMHLGRPVVATDVGGNPEVVQGGEHGLLVPFGDNEALHAALTRVLGDEVFARVLSEGARHRAEDFSIDETVRKTGELLTML